MNTARAAFLNDRHKRETAFAAIVPLLCVNCLNFETLLLQIGPLYISDNSKERRAYLICPSCKRLILVRLRPWMPAGCASACVRLFPVLPRMSLHGSWRLARVKCSCRQSQYNFWTSFGEFGREKQSICTTDVLNVYIGTCWGRGFWGGLFVESRCDLSPQTWELCLFYAILQMSHQNPEGCVQCRFIQAVF